MPQSASFDVTTGVDLQEVDNAVNQAQKEIGQRYDFKGANVSIEFKRAEDLVALTADSDFRMKALFDVLQAKLIKRGVPVKNLDIGETTPAGGDTVRKTIKLKTALDSDTAKKVASTIKEAKLKKVQAAIQGDQVRVTSPSRDDLQTAIALLRSTEFDVELKFGELSVKFTLVTLGCDKNTVDSERYVAALQDRGAFHTADADDADVIVVNTCGFIDAAKKESIDAIVAAGNRKDGGRCQAVVAVGCMVERHKSELAEVLPEVDLFLGSSEMDRLIPELVERGWLDAADAPMPHPGVRSFTGELPHVRYLKISEGCDHGCAFCAIPLMRGKHRSFTLDDVVREAQLLEAQGAREVNLVAQDLAHWGRDRRGDALGLPDLLQALIAGTDIPWFRLLYLYSAGVTPRLLELMATESRIVPYLDIPIQHASDSVLARMRRPERRATILDTLARMRDIVPGVAVRTTCIVGFPGETDEDFATLEAFLEEAAFDRVGVFTYSPQDGTRAAELLDDVPMSVKRDRLERLNEVQRLVTGERYEARIGTRARAIVDRRTPMGLEGRLLCQADDIDGITALSNGDDVQPGSLVDVLVDGVVDDVNFSASIVRLVDAAAHVPSKRRALPMATAGASMGSFGR